MDLSEDLLKKSQSPSPSPWLSSPSPSPSPAKVDLSPSPDLSTTSLLTTRNSAMKLFRTVSSDVIKECRCFFGITDTKLLIVKRKMKFVRKYCNSENGLCILFADAASLERKMLAI